MFCIIDDCENYPRETLEYCDGSGHGCNYKHLLKYSTLIVEESVCDQQMGDTN